MTCFSRVLSASLIVLSLGGVVRADPPKVGTWKPLAEFTDEFDGDKLDANKWWDHDPRWKGRQPALFLPQNISLKNGMLEISVKKEEPPAEQNPNPKEYNTYTAGCVKSKALAKYGYYEVRAKPMNAIIDCAFWFWNNDKDWATEIDVFEIFGGHPEQDKNDRMTLHTFKRPGPNGPDKTHIKSGEIYSAPYRFADDFHVYGVEWSEEEVKWYVDGELRRTAKNEYHHQALNLCMNAETSPKWFGQPTDESLPAIYYVDYVRGWERTDLPTTKPADAAK